MNKPSIEEWIRVKEDYQYFCDNYYVKPHVHEIDCSKCNDFTEAVRFQNWILDKLRNNIEINKDSDTLLAEYRNYRSTLTLTERINEFFTT